MKKNVKKKVKKIHIPFENKSSEVHFSLLLRFLNIKLGDILNRHKYIAFCYLRCRTKK